MKIISLVLTALLIFANSAIASEVIFAVDLSTPMSMEAIDGNTPLALAISQIKERATNAKETIGLVGYVDKVWFDVAPGAFDDAALDQLVPAAGESSLLAGLAAAVSLIKEVDDALVVIYTTRGDESIAQLRSQLEKSGLENLRVELNLFSQGAYQMPMLVSLEEKTTHQTASTKVDEVRAFLAEQLDVPVTALTRESDLAVDFGVGQLEAYELLLMLCEELQIPAPTDNSPSRLDAIIKYVESQKQPDPDKLAETIADGGMEYAPALSSKVVKGENGLYVQTIHYGTNRKRTGAKNPEKYFGGARSDIGPVTYGICEVTIPLSHKYGAVESPFLGLEMFADPQKHIRLHSVKPMSGEDFFASLHDSVNKEELDRWSNDLVIFVHGFNVTFAEAAKRTAQIAFDFGFTGAPVMFSWPSDGKLFSYPSDREDVNWSIAHIEQFLEDVRLKAGPKRIHLVAHSMGNQGLIGALNRIAMKSGENKRIFESITLAAPDFDAQLFAQQIAPAVVNMANRWTIYTSDNDAALNISTKVNSAKRLGLPVTALAGIDVIDASGIEVTPWSVPEFHSYYATKQTVIDDIVAAIKGVAPDLRELLPKSQGGIPYWQLKSAKVK